MNNLISCFLFLICFPFILGCKTTSPAPANANIENTGQNQVTALTSQLMADSVNITPYMEIFTGTAKKLPGGKAMDQTAAGWKSCGDAIPPGFYNQQGITWFRVTVKNTSADFFKKLLCFRDMEMVEFDYFSAETEKAGEITDRKEWSFAANSKCFYLKLNGGQTKTFYLKCFKEGASSLADLRFVLRSEQNEQSLEANEIKSNIADMAFLFFYLGFLFFCLIYFLALYIFRSKEKILLVYILYILFTFLYSLRDADKHYFLKNAFPLFNGLNRNGETVFSYLSYLFYLWFIIFLLDLKTTRKWAYRLLITVNAVIGVLLCIDVALRVMHYPALAVHLFIEARILLFPLIIVYFILLQPFRKGYYKYFLYGSVCLLLGAGLNLLVFQIRKYPSFIFHEALMSPYGFWGNTVNYTRLGVMGEIIFFSLGLSKRMQTEFVRSALLGLNSNYASIIFHEIKNSLNKLVGLIKSRSTESVEFVGKIGDILTDSLEINEISTRLADELDIAQRYFYFRLKSNQQVALEIVNAGQLNLHGITVPTMLLQPFIENCLKHAFPHQEQPDKKITIHIIPNGQWVNIVIQDNGIGLTNAINSSRSRGTQLVKQRLGLFNSIFCTSTYFETDNRPDVNGTQVTIYNLQ